LDIGGIPHLYIFDSDVDFIIEDFEEVEETTPLVS
jgi:hypothetical protein